MFQARYLLIHMIDRAWMVIVYEIYFLGSLSNPFYDLQDALTRAYELCAPFTSCQVSINLFKGIPNSLIFFRIPLPFEGSIQFLLPTFKL